MVRSVTIFFNSGKTQHWDFTFSLHGTMRMRNVVLDDKLQWIKLEHCKCPGCTLDAESYPTCPVAEVLAGYARDLADRKSYEEVAVDVFQDDGTRLTLERVPLQTVVRELVRLAVFQYECPIGRNVKETMTPLPPFPSNDEILNAFAKAFAEHTHEENGQLNSEQQAYLEELHELFSSLSARLENVGHGDAHLNGIVILHSLAVLFTLSAPELIRTLAPYHAMQTGTKKS